jgi:FkbM family methyltransferase
VFAFEPQRLVFQSMVANVALNALLNVHTLHAGLGAAPGSIKVPVLNPEKGHNFGGFSIDGHDSGESVAVQTVDSLQLRRCRLLKVDVEGMESEVLEGARDTIARACVEYVDADLPLPALSAVDCNAVFAEAEAAVRRSGEAKFERADIEVRGSLPAVKGHVPALRRVFAALLDNAIRYTNEGGRVTVRMEGGPRPTVRIADDGPTIPAADRERVFERFHRILGSPGDGSGLGLAIAREIAQMHDARIGLEPDSDGIGNVFSIVFPGHNGR